MREIIILDGKAWKSNDHSYARELLAGVIFGFLKMSALLPNPHPASIGASWCHLVAKEHGDYWDFCMHLLL